METKKQQWLSPIKKIAKALAIIAIMVVSFTLSSFSSGKHSGDNLYIYLYYEKSDGAWQGTTTRVYSDVLRYDDYQKNSLEINDRFAASAITLHEIDVWKPSIKSGGLSKSADLARTELAKDIISFRNWEEGNQRRAVVKKITLNRR
jgi:gamma-glutamylcysteine synthetase